MNHYEITSRGKTIGIYQGDTPANAIAAYVRDTGYSSIADAAACLGQTEEAFLADLHVKDMHITDLVLRMLAPYGFPIGGVEMDQQWDAGRTVIGCRDGSSVIIAGSDVIVEGGASSLAALAVRAAEEGLVLNTLDQIDALRAEAAHVGDNAQVAICERALAGDLAARIECARVIARARAMEGT
jgi:hypothetical protein